MADFPTKDLDEAVENFKKQQDEWKKQPKELNDKFDRLKVLSLALYMTYTSDRDAAQEKLKKLLEKIEEAAEGIAAPFLFIQYAANWQTVASKVRDVNNEQGRTELSLDGHWSGKAQQRYAVSRTNQTTALSTSNDMCEKVHEQLLSLARGGLDFYKSLADRLAQLLAKLATALTKVATVVEAPWGISDTIDLCGEAVLFVEQTITEYTRLMAEQQISANELKNIISHPNGFPKIDGKDHWPNSVANGFEDPTNWELAK
ncbi:hypothetical protein [Nocardia australiensis]|uniref:hypothetical protein n=1 Tax=Nocardia australiensis TaxID=2887191 RepID=UPI001D155A65|nr:hypothetical protein [Nocardia australiensis]